MELDSDYLTQSNNPEQIEYELVEENDQETYTNVTSERDSYIDVQEDPQVQEEYTDLQDVDQCETSPTSKSKPNLLPRKSQNCEEPVQDIYENEDLNANSQKHKKGTTKDPRYVQSPPRKTDEDIHVYANERESRGIFEKHQKRKESQKEEPTTEKTLSKEPGGKISLPFTPKQTSWRTRHLIILVVILLAIILLIFTIGFIAGWFGRGDNTLMNKKTNMDYAKCIHQLVPLDPEFEKCGPKEIQLVLETQPGTTMSTANKNTLIKMAEIGMTVTIAYQKPNTKNTWIYAEANHITDTISGDVCFQLYPTYTNKNLLGQGSSLALEWNNICTNGIVNGVVYAIGTGNPIESFQYELPVKWYIMKKFMDVVYKDSTGKITSFNKNTLRDYILSGHDVSVMYENSNQGQTGYFSSNVLQSLVDNMSTAQYLDLSVINCTTSCYFNYQYNKNKDYVLFMLASTMSEKNWDYMKFTVESSILAEHVSRTDNNTWSVDKCWTSVHDTWPGKTDNTETMHQLLSAVRHGHRIRAVIQIQENSFVNFEPDLLIIKNNHLYGIHIWKTKVNAAQKTRLDLSGFWEWTIISTNGKYITQYCTIGTAACQQQQNLKVVSVKWATDTYSWQPVAQRSSQENPANCDNTSALVQQALAGKAIRYKVHDLKNNTEYFHKTQYVEIHGNSEVIIRHMNEVLLQLDSSDDVQFDVNPTMIYREVSSSGYILQHKFLYGQDHPVTYVNYNYLTGREYNITWFT